MKRTAAILTKFLGPTDTKGSRIKAYMPDGSSVTVAYPYGKSPGSEAHEPAALAALEKMEAKYQETTGESAGYYLTACVMLPDAQWPHGYAFTYEPQGQL